MARDQSLVARKALFDQETSEVFLILLEIDHDTLNSPYRFVLNNADITHNTYTYVAYNFNITTPSEEDGQITEVDITLDNVDRSITQTIRKIDSPPEVTMKVVLASNPDTTEAGPFRFSLQDVTYDIVQISGKLGFPPVLDEGFPGVNYTALNHPAMM